jgi:hypothetical protein
VFDGQHQSSWTLAPSGSPIRFFAANMSAVTSAGARLYSTFCGATFLLFVAANLIRGIRHFLLVCTKLTSDNSRSGDVDKS